MHIVTAALAGLIFGLGLIVSGMADPGKVIGFLDLAGRWDPSLAFVMAGAIGVGVLGFGLARRRSTTWLGEPTAMPERASVDRRLVVGSIVFGIGWGLGGFCPGPGVVAIGLGRSEAVLFVGAMLTGMLLFEWFERKATLGTRPVQPAVQDG